MARRLKKRQGCRCRECRSRLNRGAVHGPAGTPDRRAGHPRIGVFTGYSAIAWHEHCRKDGRLLTCDISEVWTDIARLLDEAASRAHRTGAGTCHGYAAGATWPPAKPDAMFMAFIDADKTAYTDTEACMLRLRADQSWSTMAM